jgi:hypothetical protein
MIISKRGKRRITKNNGRLTDQDTAAEIVDGDDERIDRLCAQATKEGIADERGSNTRKSGKVV